MSRKHLLLIISILYFFSASAQNNRRPFQEVGLFVGPVFFQGDFGERSTLENTTKNVGYNVGLVYYLSSDVRSTRSIYQKFKLRFDVSGTSVSLQHYGPSASSNSQFGQKLRAMRSDVRIGTIGAQLEYYHWKTDDYSRKKFSPFIAVGTQLNSYSAKAYSSLGNIGNLNVVPEKYVEGFKDSRGVVMSLSSVLGFRYKLDDSNGIVVEGQLKYYFSDWVEGMNPERSKYTENKNNDFSATLNIGYVYYLD